MTTKKSEQKLPEYKIAAVKFHSKMEETTPVLNFGTVMDIANQLQCENAHELAMLINSCYATEEREGKEVTILKNQKLFMDISVCILANTTRMAYELQDKTVDFTPTQIKAKLTLELCAQIISWFIKEGITKLNEVEPNPNPNGIIQIM